MSALSISLVRSWRPDALDGASAAVGQASDAVDREARSVGRALENALAGAGGYWASAASDRAAEEAKTGAQLADALDLARTALRNGATDIGEARTRLLDSIAAAEGEGFKVADDGSVTAPTLPPVMSSPEHRVGRDGVAQRGAGEAQRPGRCHRQRDRLRPDGGRHGRLHHRVDAGQDRLPPEPALGRRGLHRARLETARTCWAPSARPAARPPSATG